VRHNALLSLSLTYVCVFSWTMADVNVACQQLGFRTGNFTFLPWARNDSSYMLYLKPSCVGSEASILDCPGARDIRIGSKICRQFIFLLFYLFNQFLCFTAHFDFIKTVHTVVDAQLSLCDFGRIWTLVELLHWMAKLCF